jgi:hypothetical protein
MVLLLPEMKRLFYFFFSEKIYSKEKWKPLYTKKWKRFTYAGIKIFVFAGMIYEVGMLYRLEHSLNDDAVKRPPMHGAYEVNLFILNNDTLPPLITDKKRWRRVFIHRRDYFITQGMDDRMKSHDCNVDTVRKIIMINTPNHNRSYLHYKKINDSLFSVYGNYKEDSVKMEWKKINLEKLPLLRKDFEWMWGE